MSQIIVYNCPYCKHTIDFLDKLPTSAVQVKSFKGRKLKPIYWVDLDAQRLIKKNGKNASHPFRYVRSGEMVLFMADTTTQHVATTEVIASFQQ